MPYQILHDSVLLQGMKLVDKIRCQWFVHECSNHKWSDHKWFEGEGALWRVALSRVVV
jgi:hypothetical protein